MRDMRAYRSLRCKCLIIFLMLNATAVRLEKYLDYHIPPKLLRSFRSRNDVQNYFTDRDKNSSIVKSSIQDGMLAAIKSFEYNINKEKYIHPRIRRSQVESYTEQHILSQEELYDLSQLSLQHCPFADFCFSNGSSVTDPRTNRVSCCRNCYCDEGCGERMDCCFDFLDNTKIVERNKLSCITPRVKAKSQRIISVQSYLMVDTCLNDSYACKYKRAEIWGSLYPAYSPSTKLIYYNRHCAACNGINDTIVWNVYISCEQIFTLKGQFFYEKVENGSCGVHFRPPTKRLVDKYICYTDVISSCSDGGQWKDFKEICESSKAIAEVQNPGEVQHYANVFCKLCNGIKNYPFTACRAYDDGFRTVPVESFMALINWDVVHSHVSVDDYVVGERSEKAATCREFEAKHPNEMECRPLSCPNGTIRTKEGCKLYATTWYKRGFLIHVILTPVSKNLLPLAAFNKTHGNVKAWFDAKGISINSINIDAEIVIVQNISYTRRLNIRVGNTEFPLLATKLLKTIQLSMMKRWEITLDSTKYLYSVKFDKYEFYVQNGLSKRKKIFSVSYRTEPRDLPTVYHPVFNSQKLIYFYINKLYFCDQIDLLHDEWIEDYQGIRLNLTGSGDMKFLGDAEFNYHQDTDGEWQVQICVEDFTSLSAIAGHFISYEVFSAAFMIYFLLKQ